ncbi:MAG TPA: hypothetical protein V6D20_07745, partial [Candidatus Obscuribacterales bacterium]
SAITMPPKKKRPKVQRLKAKRDLTEELSAIAYPPPIKEPTLADDKEVSWRKGLPALKARTDAVASMLEAQMPGIVLPGRLQPDGTTAPGPVLPFVQQVYKGTPSRGFSRYLVLQTEIIRKRMRS